jgi:enoyl-CoA hydratase/carnithine racemase
MSDLAPRLTRPSSHVAELRLRRPAKANRLSPADLATIVTLLDEVERDASVHVLVIAAEGANFCAGFDLGALTGPERRSRAGGDESAFERMADRLAATRPITIAAINGPVVGGGTDLALACDLRIGVEATTFMMPAARIGVPLYAGALERYVTRFGIDVAKRLVLLGERISAPDLARLGILAGVVPDRAALDARVEAMAADLAALPSKPLAAMKQVLGAATRGEARSADNRTRLHAAFDPEVVAARVAAEAARRRK